MRRVVTGLLMLVLSGAPALSQEETEIGIRDVISGQIEAFRANDFNHAFTYASPMIQGMFGDPQRFGQMVQQGYPMIHQPADLKFLDAEKTPDGMRQRVMVKDARGAIHVLAYDMILVQGVWQINGVELLDAARGA